MFLVQSMLSAKIRWQQVIEGDFESGFYTVLIDFESGFYMVLILDDNLEHVAHARTKKKNLFGG